MTSWKDRHVHLTAMLIVWPLVAIGIFLVYAIISYASGFALDYFGIGERAGLIATSMTAAWIARAKRRSIGNMILSFIIPLYALVLHNNKVAI